MLPILIDPNGYSGNFNYYTDPPIANTPLLSKAPKQKQKKKLKPIELPKEQKGSEPILNARITSLRPRLPTPKSQLEIHARNLRFLDEEEDKELMRSEEWKSRLQDVAFMSQRQRKKSNQSLLDVEKKMHQAEIDKAETLSGYKFASKNIDFARKFHKDLDYLAKHDVITEGWYTRPFSRAQPISQRKTNSKKNFNQYLYLFSGIR